MHPARDGVALKLHPPGGRVVPGVRRPLFSVGEGSEGGRNGSEPQLNMAF